jgi:hypothetical protein
MSEDQLKRAQAKSRGKEVRGKGWAALSAKEKDKVLLPFSIHFSSLSQWFYSGVLT